MIQAAPFSIQIELVEGCPLRCSFCGINGIRRKKPQYKFITMKTATRIAEQIALNKWTSRIEFAMHGEPTMHPKMLKIIQVFRKHLPKNYFLMLTNGFGIRLDAATTVPKILEAGINCLGIDRYVDVNWSDRIMVQLTKADIAFLPYPEAGAAANPHHRIHMKRIVMIAPIDIAITGVHSNLENHCGAAAPLDFSSREKRCARPFRELSIRYDGNVAICCNDFRGVYKIANINDISLDKLWQHPRFRAARRKLYHKQRNFGSCDGCNQISYRVGFLPDKFGKEALPPPNPNDRKRIREALAGQPFTKPVLRPWEK